VTFGGGGDPIIHETKEIKTVAIYLGAASTLDYNLFDYNGK